MRCPRCHAPVPATEARPPREAAPAPSFCRACGAPLRLADEPLPSPLDAPLAVDRRAAGRVDPSFADSPTPLPPETAEAPGAPAGELAGLERSQWNLGTPAAVEGGPPAAAAALAADWTPAEVEALEIHLRRPEWWRRAAADAIDVLPFVVGGVALARSLVRAAGVGLPAPATGIDGFLDLLARERVIVLSVAAAVTLALATYTTLSHSLAGATLGKRLLGLALVGPDGARPTLARSAARSALAVLSTALLGLGVLLPFFTRSGRALHDLLARTWVVEAP